MRGFTLQDLGFVGGLSVVGGDYTITDPDAAAWVASVEGSSGDNQALENAIKQAIDTYVQALKSTGVGDAADSIWTSAIQLLLPCGPRTLPGALRPLKGAVPTNVNWVSGNYNRKNGLGKAANTNAYLVNNVQVNSIQATNHTLFCYGAITRNSGDSILMGRYDGVSPLSLIALDEWAGYASGRAFRSGTFSVPNFPVITSTAAAACVIGSRTSSTNATLYVDSLSDTKVNNITPTLSTQSFYTYALNQNNTPQGHSFAILQATGIFSPALNGAQASALRTATANYVAAVAAAIP